MENLKYECECKCNCGFEWENDEPWELLHGYFYRVSRDKLNIVHPDCPCRRFDLGGLYVTTPDSPDVTINDIKYLPESEN